MGIVWEPEYRYGKMLEVEVTVAQIQATMGLIPKKAAKDIADRAKFSVKRINEIELTTKHDVIAFVSNVAENIGVNGKYVHYGLTSSDVLDTAFSLQVRDAVGLIIENINRLEKTMQTLIKKNESTLCPGRTHGMFAEPTTFGFKIAGFLSELRRNKKRVLTALGQMQICKLSGAVGTFSSTSPDLEKKVAKKLKLTPEPIATQVIPRDRHAEMIFSLCMIMSGLERLSVELRHLQRSEVGEVVEGFTVGQKGSSAMPHKKNPISAENITGLSRLLRGYLLSSLENIALWHERDISHSSVERVIFPDAFIVTDYALNRMNKLLEGLYISKKNMLNNLELSQGQIFSSHLLLALVEKGMQREVAYSHIQRLSHSLAKGEHLEDKILADTELKRFFNKKELAKIFSGEKHIQSIKKVLKGFK